MPAHDNDNSVVVSHNHMISCFYHTPTQKKYPRICTPTLSAPTSALSCLTIITNVELLMSPFCGH